MLEKKYHCMRSSFAPISLENRAETHSCLLGAKGGFEVMLNVLIQVNPISWERLVLFGKFPPLRDTDGGRGDVEDGAKHY